MDEFEAALMAERGGVGNVHIRHPRAQVGQAIAPRYVGAPVEQVDDLDQSPVKWSEGQPVAGENTWFGLGVTSVAAGATVTLTFRPNRPIAVVRYLMPSTVFGLLILGFNISGTQLLPAGAGVPVEFFSEVSTAPNIDWLTIQTTPGVDIQINNPTLNPLNFSGAFYGTALRY